MADINAQLGWSEAQWNKVNSAVTEEFTKASVAGAFLPCYGPLAASAETVREEILDTSSNARVRVSDDGTLRLWNLTVNVELSNQQIVDDALSSALLAFRRAANTLARVEDYIVFSGYARPAGVQLPRVPSPAHLSPPIPGIAPLDIDAIVASGDDYAYGLTEEGDSFAGAALVTFRRGVTTPLPLGVTRGEAIVQQVVDAITDLEASSHLGPFACVLGNRLFVDVHTPNGSLVLPADRITPMLNGPLLRASSMDTRVGIVVSLAGESIDLVVATPPQAQFLQVTGNARYFFRVYERFALRIKEVSDPWHPGAVYTFNLP